MQKMSATSLFHRPQRSQRAQCTAMALVGLAVSAWLCGCSRSDRPPTVPVSGKITFDGGPCPAPGVINFSPISVADGMPRRPGSGRFESDGTFRVTSFDEGDGLVPGTYSVRIDCWKRPPLGDGNPPISYIAPGYTPPEVEVSLSGPAVQLDLDVPCLAD